MQTCPVDGQTAMPLKNDMILAVDVSYNEDDASAIVAGVLFAEWTAPLPLKEIVIRVDQVAPYEPGRFYKRELPCIQALLQHLHDITEQAVELSVIVVDGFVWLDRSAQPKPGLGAHLFAALNEQVAVIGVAKSQFAGSGATELRRGQSTRPLYVSSAGMELANAVECVNSMHGEFRIPTLLQRVDALSKGKG